MVLLHFVLSAIGVVLTSQCPLLVHGSPTAREVQKRVTLTCRSALCWCMVLLHFVLSAIGVVLTSQCPLLVHGSPTAREVQKRVTLTCRSALCWCMVLLPGKIVFGIDYSGSQCPLLVHGSPTTSYHNEKAISIVAVPSVGAWFSYNFKRVLQLKAQCRSALCWCMVLLLSEESPVGHYDSRSALCWCMVLLPC